MKKEELEKILKAVKNGELEIGEAIDQIKMAPFRDLGFAKIDTQRELRQGIAEVIYGEGKNAKQIEDIVKEMIRNNQKTILITRLSKEKADFISKNINLDYREDAQIGVVGEIPEPVKQGTIVIATGGSCDSRGAWK